MRKGENPQASALSAQLLSQTSAVLRSHTWYYFSSGFTKRNLVSTKMSSSLKVESAYPTTTIWYKQPFKTIYIATRLLALIALVPSWLITYSLLPRPRASWTLGESVLVRIIRWIMPLNATCGLSPLSTDKTRQVPETELKETSFVWIEPARDSFLKGPALDPLVSCTRIPGYIWPKAGDLGKSDDTSLVGLFVHGGGYMMGNGSETFAECDIARKISKTTKIKNILSVDYRLVNDAPHPAQLIDALSGYCHLTDVLGIPSSRIVIIGSCAGGHLALMLTRYLHDEQVLPLPLGLMLFSPWVDMVIDKNAATDNSISRPNSNIDLLATSYLANLRFLGHHPPSLLSSSLLSANLAPSGAYIGYPKTFVSVGECEAFKRECEELVTKMVSDGVDVVFNIQADAVHDFWGLGGGIPSERARAQLSYDVEAWVDALDSPSG